VGGVLEEVKNGIGGDLFDLLGGVMSDVIQRNAALREQYRVREIAVLCTKRLVSRIHTLRALF
jgi:hypothetical protein